MRFEDLRNVTLQERDVSLLADPLQSRVLTLDQIRALSSPGKCEMAKNRIQRLKSAGPVAEPLRRIGEPSILHLILQGYGALRESGHVGDELHLTATAIARRMAVSGAKLTHDR